MNHHSDKLSAAYRSWYCEESSAIKTAAIKPIKSAIFLILLNLAPRRKKALIMWMYQHGLVKPIEVEFLFSRYGLKGE